MKIIDLMKGARQLRELLLADKYRPGYHFTVPDDIGIPGDPNGAFWGRDGRYHLMYLYNRRDVKFCWGHISSLDLVHWRHHPDAIGPEGEMDGCFSGGGLLLTMMVLLISHIGLFKIMKEPKPKKVLRLRQS